MQSRLWRLGAAALLAIVMAAAVAVFLDFYKFRQAVEALTRARVNAAGSQIERVVRESLAVGLQFSALDDLPDWVVRQRQSEPLISVIDVALPDGRIVYSSDLSRVGETLPAAWMARAARVRPGEWVERIDGVRVTGGVLKNNFELPVGVLAMRYVDPHQAVSEAAFLKKLLPGAAGLALAAVALVLLCVGWMARHRVAPCRRVALLVTGVPLAAMLAMLSLLTLQQFDQELSPALQQWGRVFARSEAALVSEAAKLGLPARDLYGVTERFESQREANRELGYLALRDANGALLASVGAPPAEGLIVVPVMSAGEVYAQLALGIDPAFARHLIKDLALDLVVLLVVALFLALEVWAALEVSAQGGGGADFALIRAPAFMFFFAEEVTRPVMPGLVGQLARGNEWLSAHFLAGAPIMLFMLIVALSQPLLGAWVARHDRRRLMLLGAGLAVLGFVGCAMADSVWQVMLARTVGAMGYATLFVASQAFVVDHTAPARRAEGFALLVSAIMVASVCGPPLGGMLADNLGLHAPFVAAAGLAAVSLVLALRMPLSCCPPSQGATVSPFKALSALGNTRFAALCFCAALPAKMLLTGLAFYLLPLYAASLGGSSATAGRLLLLYGLVMVMLVPLAARLSDRLGCRESFTVGGLLVSALGALGVALAPGFYSLAFAMLILGLGQAFSIASQSALVGVFAEREARSFGETAVYGAYRFIERLGNAAGPLVAGFFLAGWGFESAFLGLSGVVLMLAAVFFVVVRRHQTEEASCSVARS
ncbi:MAG: hypothetical protein RIR70_833 [Pseudomonadota bacterium]